MLTTIEDAVEILKQGKMIILVDDEHRENEGDLCMLAEHVTPDDVNFMARYGRGLICLTMTQQRLKALDIPPMTAHNTSRFHTAFHVSIEAAEGVTTGISAADRAHTMKLASSESCRPSDLARPGHVFPIAARPGGVLVRIGQTEGSVDLARIAGSKIPAGIICEIMKDDGTMARMPDLEVFAQIHSMPIVTIADLVEYRLRSESLVTKTQERMLNDGIARGFKAISFKCETDGTTHLALTWNLENRAKTPLVRVHSGAVWNDLLGLNDDEHALGHALDRIREHGCGALLYIHRDDDALESALTGTRKHDEDEVNRVAPDTKLYGIGAQCLRALGLTDMILLTDTPKKLAAIEGFGLHISNTMPLL